MSKKMPHSKWVLRNSNLLSTDFGRLTPFYFSPTVPGDKLRLGSQFNVQLAPLLSPAYQDCRMYVHYYWVPNRVCYVNEEYNAFVSREQRKLAYMDSVPVSKSTTTIGDIVTVLNRVYRNNNSGSVVPYKNDFRSVLNMLPDYLRIQFSTASDYSKVNDTVIIEPFVAYFKIFLDHYCSTQYPTYFVKGTNSNGTYTYHIFTYEDLTYFYSWLQKYGFDTVITASTTWIPPSLNTATSVLDILLQVGHVMYGRMGDMFMEMYPTQDYIDTQPTGSTIMQLRMNSAIARYKEIKARVGHGTREFFRAFFHINSKDSSIRISRLLGGGRSNINIDDIPQTSETTESSAQATLAGNGWKKTSFGFGKRYFDDYGYVLGVVYLLPRQAYYNGIDELWKRDDADQLYLEAFDSLGDEPVFKRELAFGTSNNDDVIAYQPRFKRYKRVKNEIHGDFCDTLQYFHQSRFLPVSSNASNIRCAFSGPQGLKRIFNYNGVLSEADCMPIWLYVKNKARWRRPMRYKSKPRIE